MTLALLRCKVKGSRARALADAAALAKENAAMGTPMTARAADPRIAPEDCRSLDDARAQIDRVDAVLLDMLAEREGYVRAIARHKRATGVVRDPARVEEMVRRARQGAVLRGSDPDIAEAVWRALAEAAAVFQERLLAAGADEDDAAR